MLAINTQLYKMQKGWVNHPDVSSFIGNDFNWVSIGGGGKAFSSDLLRHPPQGTGTLLTASFPENGRTWRCLAKDHFVSIGGDISVRTIALNNSSKQFTIKVFSAKTTTAENHPIISVKVPPEYKMLGGGAKVDYKGVGNILTAIYPKSINEYEARSKDHCSEDKALLEVFAIGLYDPNDIFETTITSVKSVVSSHPTAKCDVAPGFTLVGGGAFVDWKNQGNLLNASYPETTTTWACESKDHKVSDPASITCYAIGLRFR